MAFWDKAKPDGGREQAVTLLAEQMKTDKDWESVVSAAERRQIATALVNTRRAARAGLYADDCRPDSTDWDGVIG